MSAPALRTPMLVGGIPLDQAAYRLQLFCQFDSKVEFGWQDGSHEEISPCRRNSMTPKQVRAARALLGWSQAELAKKAELGITTIADCNSNAAKPRLVRWGQSERHS